MKLRAYLEKNNIPVAYFADTLGVTRQTVYSYIKNPNEKNYTTPRRMKMTKIVNLTGGQVSYNDFFLDNETQKSEHIHEKS